jgi:hypothetical protein
MGLGPSAWSGTPDMADINEFSISCYTGSKSCEIDVDDIRTTPKRDNGAVVFIFDDANETDYTTAYDVLSSRGYAGSSAIIPRVVGDDGKLSQRQMDQMDSDGWAWPNHPQADSRSGGLGSVSGDKAEQMMRDNKRWLLDNGYERGADTLVWPFGDFDAEALDIAGDYYRLAWGVVVPRRTVSSPSRVGYRALNSMRAGTYRTRSPPSKKLTERKPWSQP